MPTYGFTGTVSDTNFARMQALQGVRVGVEGPTHWVVTATGADRTVSISAGNGYLPGLRHETTGATTVQCAINASGSIRYDLIVARANFTAKTVTFVAITGTPGAGGPPAADRTLLATGSIYDFPIVACRVISGGGAFNAGTDLYDLRLWGGIGGAYQIPQEAFYTYHDLVVGAEIRAVNTNNRYRRTASGWESPTDLLSGAGLRLYVEKSVNETVTSSTAFQNDDHLTVSVAANATYVLRLGAIYNAAVAGGLRIQFALPAGAVLSNGRFVTGGTGSATQHGPNTSTVGQLTGIVGLAADAGLDVWHRLVTSATPGAATLQWAQDTSNATGTILRAGSSLLLERVA